MAVVLFFAVVAAAVAVVAAVAVAVEVAVAVALVMVVVVVQWVGEDDSETAVAAVAVAVVEELVPVAAAIECASAWLVALALQCYVASLWHLARTVAGVTSAICDKMSADDSCTDDAFAPTTHTHTPVSRTHPFASHVATTQKS